MKRILIHTLLWVSVFQIKTFEAGAQSLADSPDLNTPLYRETLCLFTDRNLYASGETVSFRLYNLSHPLLKETQWSRVFYLELINSRNAPVARGKYPVYPWGSSGQIVIPDTAGTGYYHLRAYTRWMRNYPPSGYYHLPLAIVNPRRPGSADLSTRGKGTDSPVVVPGPKARIACSTDKSVYGKREKVTVQIHPDSTVSSPDGYCISVIRKGTLDTAYRYTQAPAGKEPLRLEDLAHLPETGGAILSGTVLAGEGQEPAKRTLLGITLLGPEPDYFEFITDENGRFRIPVQQQAGIRDALLTIYPMRDAPLEILPDEAFSSDFSASPVPAADFFGERRSLVEEAIVHSQLRAAFELPDNDRADAAASPSGDLFYGTPEFRYRMEDYVVLPDLEEFLFEIVTQVRVEKTNGPAHLAVLDDRGEIIYAPPLILLDHVPVPEIGKLLQVSPQQIDHIDVVNRIYVRGGSTYGGIVHIVTRRGDRAGIALPGGSAFITFTGLSDLQEAGYPDYDQALRKDRIPDLRSTLFWDAHYEITPENGGSFTCFTSDVTGEFMVVVRGMTSAGKTWSGTCKFTVK